MAKPRANGASGEGVEFFREQSKFKAERPLNKIKKTWDYAGVNPMSHRKLAPSALTHHPDILGAVGDCELGIQPRTNSDKINGFGGPAGAAPDRQDRDISTQWNIPLSQETQFDCEGEYNLRTKDGFIVAEVSPQDKEYTTDNVFFFYEDFETTDPATGKTVKGMVERANLKDRL